MNGTRGRRGPKRALIVFGLLGLLGAAPGAQRGERFRGRLSVAGVPNGGVYSMVGGRVAFLDDDLCRP